MLFGNLLANVAMSPVAIRMVGYAIVFVLGALTMHSCTSSRYKAELAELRKQHAEQIAEIERQKLASEQQARAAEQKYRSLVDAARKELGDAILRIEEQQRAIDRMRRDRGVLVDGLRNALSAYATGAAAGQSAADSIAACHARAAALAGMAADGADLLAEGAGLLERVAEAHDRRAAEVRSLLSAWPSAQ